ncbi:MAG TPA: EamA family transporter, partial [Herpetosiphonaceae bacterium]|nr:EamA family transporter [Herpetosiphonaceae bacterium]
MKDLLLTGAAPVLWGTTYYVTNAWLPQGYPLFIALMRALPMGLILCLLTRQLPRGHWWWRSAVLGFLNIGLFFALLFLAATRLPGGVAATVGAIQPLLVIGLVWAILKQRPALRSIGFGLVGLGGVALLVLTPAARLDLLGVAAMVGATLSMAAGTVIGKKWGLPPVPLLSFTAWQLVAGGLLLAPVALLAEGIPPAIGAPQALG